MNGILVHVTNLNAHFAKVCNRQVDKVVNNICVFLRPYAHNFLEFCLENFDVALWSSRKMKNLESIVDMFPNIRNKLIFCWDQNNCMTIYTTEGRPLHFKELANIWETYPQYDESNTLLVDDDPYKAIQNPVNTGIFPSSPSIWAVNPDNELGPEGSLRMYLDCLAKAKNVKDYVRMNPYGQPAITETHVEWNFYQELIESFKRDDDYDNEDEENVSDGGNYADGAGGQDQYVLSTNFSVNTEGLRRGKRLVQSPYILNERLYYVDKAQMNQIRKKRH